MTNRAACYLRSSKDRSEVSIDAQRRALQELAMACQLVAAMISGTTGSIGGRDQAANFAEIAFDMLDAIHAEKLKREA